MANIPHSSHFRNYSSTHKKHPSVRSKKRSTPSQKPGQSAKNADMRHTIALWITLCIALLVGSLMLLQWYWTALFITALTGFIVGKLT